MIRKFLPAIIIIAILFIGCGKSEKTNKLNRTGNSSTTTNYQVARKGSKMPDFTAKTIDGTSFKISDYRGKVLIVDIWATWCPPCKKEIPGFINIVKKYPKSDISIVGISMDNRISKSQLQGFVEKSGMNYPVVLITENRLLMSVFADVRNIPTTYIIDADGIVRDRVVGMAPQSYFENRIQSILKNRSAKRGV